MFEEALERSRNEEIQEKYQKFIGQLNAETQQHSYNVAALCESCAAPLMMNTHLAYKIGLLHDIGKVFIPSRIMKKNKGLTELERGIIDLHSYFGYQLLKEIGEPAEVTLPVLFHHGFNKYKLTEYDEVLTPDIVKYIYLVHSADIYDAMTSTRVYHSALDKQYVYDMLAEDAMCSRSILSAIYYSREKLSCTGEKDL